MSVLTTVGILLLSMLIMASLKLVPGVFLIFSHYASGKFSRNKRSDLSIFLIFGVETFAALLFVVLNFIIYAFGEFFESISGVLPALIMAGILLATGLVFPFCYFRKGKGTRLFISRKIATQLDYRAKTVEKRSDAFMLGFIASAQELVFTLPLYVLASFEIMRLGETAVARAALILVFIFAMIAPLVIINSLFNRGYNLADLERRREKNKTFWRFLISILYIVVAAIIIIFGVLS